MRPSFRLQTANSLLGSHVVWKEDKEALWGPFYKDMNPIHKGSTLVP